MRYFFVSCPGCGHMKHLKFANLKWPEGKPEEAKYSCECCDFLMEEHHKEQMLAETVDATSGDVQAVVYLAGEFNESALMLGAGHTLDSIRDGLRSKSTFLRKNVP